MIDRSHEVRKERSGWRDKAISERHRKWGRDLPIYDIDFLVIEFDSAKPYCLVEYKHERANPGDCRLDKPGYVAASKLCNAAGLPFFMTHYANDFSWWRVVPINFYAKAIITETATMTEDQWIGFLESLKDGWRME